MLFFQILEFNLFDLLIISYISHLDHFKHEVYEIYLFVFSDDSILKTGNTCNHSIPAQNPKSLYINREVQANLNEANNSNIIEENNTLKLKLNKFKYDQVYFEENLKDVLYYTGLSSHGTLKSLF